MTVSPGDRHAHSSGTDVTLFVNDEFELHITPHGADGLRVQAPSLARALGFHAARDLLRSIPDDEKGWELSPTPGGDQRVGYVTEAGFYRALGQRQVARITDPGARDTVQRFQSWVYGDVLPKLRRGEVVTVERPTSELDILRRAIDQIEEAQQRAARAEQAAIEAGQEATVANARLDAIEGRHEYFAALGWAKIRKFAPTDERTLAALGRVASTVGKQSGMLPGSAPHAHYGSVNTWPLEVWDEAARRMRGAA